MSTYRSGAHVVIYMFTKHKLILLFGRRLGPVTNELVNTSSLVAAPRLTLWNDASLVKTLVVYPDGAIYLKLTRSSWVSKRHVRAEVFV